MVMNILFSHNSITCSRETLYVYYVKEKHSGTFAPLASDHATELRMTVKSANEPKQENLNRRSC